MCFRRTQANVASVSKDGAAPMVRDAAHEAAESVEDHANGSSP